MYIGTRLTTAIHRRLFSGFFLREGAQGYINTGYINITNSFSFSLHNVPFSNVFRSRAIAYITEDNFII